VAHRSLRRDGFLRGSRGRRSAVDRVASSDWRKASAKPHRSTYWVKETSHLQCKMTAYSRVLFEDILVWARICDCACLSSVFRA
jgi:hypothetical protein